MTVRLEGQVLLNHLKNRYNSWDNVKKEWFQSVWACENIEEFKKLVDGNNYEETQEFENGTTVLHRAAGMRDSSILKYLISLGIDLSIKNSYGHAVLYYCFVRSESKYIVRFENMKILLDAGFVVNDYHNHAIDMIPYDVIYSNRGDAVIRLLLNYGAISQKPENLPHWVPNYTYDVMCGGMLFEESMVTVVLCLRSISIPKDIIEMIISLLKKTRRDSSWIVTNKRLRFF